MCLSTPQQGTNVARPLVGRRINSVQRAAESSLLQGREVVLGHVLRILPLPQIDDHLTDPFDAVVGQRDVLGLGSQADTDALG